MDTKEQIRQVLAKKIADSSGITLEEKIKAIRDAQRETASKKIGVVRARDLRVWNHTRQ